MNDDNDTAPLSVLRQRRIEASFIKPFLSALVSEVGDERAAQLVRSVVEGLARAHGHRQRIALAPGLEGLAQAWDGFAAGGALDLDVRERSETRLCVRVTRCRYAEMYRELGLESWGPVLSCSRDGPFAEGLCPEAKLERSTPLMEGGAFCEFLYTKEHQ
jgi:hypothetical protein